MAKILTITIDVPVWRSAGVRERLRRLAECSDKITLAECWEWHRPLRMTYTIIGPMYPAHVGAAVNGLRSAKVTYASPSYKRVTRRAVAA